MPFISRSQLSSLMKAPHEDQYKRQLKSALLDPSLTEERRSEIIRSLDNLRSGVGKEYRAETPSPVGAISLD